MKVTSEIGMRLDLSQDWWREVQGKLPEMHSCLRLYPSTEHEHPQNRIDAMGGTLVIPGVRGHLQLHINLKDNLGYMRPCPLKGKNNPGS